MIGSAPRGGPTRSYLKGGDRRVAAGNLARHRLFSCAKETGGLAASIALGFLDLVNCPAFKRLWPKIRSHFLLLPKRKKLPRAGKSRTRSRAPSSGAIPFLPVATPKWATTGMESRPASILLSVSRRESAKVWGELPPLSGVKSGKDVPPDDQSRSSHPDRPVACRSA
jgi:hypothetical protein